MDENKLKAGFVLRGGAAFFDSVVITLPLVVIFRILGFDKEDTIPALIYLMYMWYMTATRGVTLGKRYFGLKVVTINDGSVGYGRAFLREVLGKILSSIVFSLGYFWVIWDKNKQAWHDKIAGTVVIREREVGKGRVVLANILVWIFPVVMILAIFGTIILIAINPARQIEKAKQYQENRQIQEEKLLPTGDDSRG